MGAWSGVDQRPCSQEWPEVATNVFVFVVVVVVVVVLFVCLGFGLFVLAWFQDNFFW